MLKLVEIYEPVTTHEMVEQEIKEHEVMFQNMSDEELVGYLNEHGQANDYGCYYMMAWDIYKARQELRFWQETVRKLPDRILSVILGKGEDEDNPIHMIVRAELVRRKQ